MGGGGAAVLAASVESSPDDPPQAAASAIAPTTRIAASAAPHPISTGSSAICSPSSAPRLMRNARISGASRSAIDTIR